MKELGEKLKNWESNERIGREMKELVEKGKNQERKEKRIGREIKNT